MPKILLKPRLQSNKIEQKPKPEIQNTTATFPPNLQQPKQKTFSGNGFIVYK